MSCARPRIVPAHSSHARRWLLVRSLARPPGVTLPRALYFQICLVRRVVVCARGIGFAAGRARLLVLLGSPCCGMCGFACVLSLSVSNRLPPLRLHLSPPAQPPPPPQVSNLLPFIVRRCPASFATFAAFCPPAASVLMPITAAVVLAAAASPAAMTVAAAASHDLSHRASPRPRKHRH